MNDQQSIEKITRQVRVTHQDVVIAKCFIMGNFNTASDMIMRRFLEHLGINKPEKVIVNPAVPLEPQLTQVANYFRWQLAFVEALWSLIGEGLVLPTSNSLASIKTHQEWTSEYERGGGSSAGWRFEELNSAYPSAVRLAPSLQGKTPQPLANPDLFLKDLNIPNLHQDIEDALRQAVQCFRHELYLPCIAMLGMASEGSWIELGLKLLQAIEHSSGLSKANKDKIGEELQSQYTSVLQKMETVAKLYERKDLFGEVIKESGYGPRQLAQVLNWSNVVRDSRNAIHFGAGSASTNTYEKVAALLLGVPVNLRVLYAIMDKADSLNYKDV